MSVWLTAAPFVQRICPCKGLGGSSHAPDKLCSAHCSSTDSCVICIYLKAHLLNKEQRVHRHQCGHTADTSEIAAPLQVTHLLSEESREHASVAALTHQLVELQAEVQTAHERLHQTQARVEHNLERVSALKAEAASLEKLRQQSAAEGSSSQGMACRPPAATAHHSAAAWESKQVGCSCLPRGQHVLLVVGQDVGCSCSHRVAALTIAWLASNAQVKELLEHCQCKTGHHQRCKSTRCSLLWHCSSNCFLQSGAIHTAPKCQCCLWLQKKATLLVWLVNLVRSTSAGAGS